MPARVVVVLVTVPNAAVGRRIAEAVVKRRLAACVNSLPGVTSVFLWAGKMDRCREQLLLIKTTAARMGALQQAIRALHPYKVPELIALPVVAGASSYMRWVRASVS